MELPQLSEADRRERLLQFIDVVCCGSQRQAAIKLGVTGGTISRIVSDDIPVSRKLFHVMASIPNISSDWLATGAGNPIRNVPKILVDIGSIVPVAKKLLPGPLLEHEDLLSNEFIAVPRASYGVGVYAVPVSALIAGVVARVAARWLQDHLFKPADTLLINTAMEVVSVKCVNSLGVVMWDGSPVLRQFTDDCDARVGVVTHLFRSF